MTNPQSWSRAAACLAVLGGEYMDVSVGMVVACKGGDEATVLDGDSRNKLVTVAKTTSPRGPVVLPMDQVGKGLQSGHVCHG